LAESDIFFRVAADITRLATGAVAFAGTDFFTGDVFFGPGFLPTGFLAVLTGAAATVARVAISEAPCTRESRIDQTLDLFIQFRYGSTDTHPSSVRASLRPAPSPSYQVLHVETQP
jgi:hypothetical protein